MNVLAILPLYVPSSRVGAWITTHEYLAGLAARGHQVDVVVVNWNDPEYEIDGVHVHPNNSDVPSPDVVVTHLGGGFDVSRMVERWQVPSVRMVHGYSPENLSKLTITKPDLAVFASLALAQDVGWDGPGMVAHPPVFAERYRCRPGKAITLTNLSSEKGGSLLGWISEAHPDQAFLGVLGWGVQADRQAPNVEVIEPVEDMRTVYRRTRTLLMPSVRESYGRVGVEAACSGIPTIAHPSPGLVEALGPCATWVDRADRTAWIAAVRELRDPDAWKAASTRARGAIQKDPASTVAAVCDAIEAVAR